MEALMSEKFFTNRMKLRSRPVGFILFGKLGVDFLHFWFAISKYKKYVMTDQSQT